ncbi:hypothetical protein [Psychromonas algicola]|uniref:hypothetical protein n=1 Tax=Psychromonas algicola TaxID=2555642 RepID=UPI0010682E83|nr:hypothetical protein [Psychromonas sp. RZ5]TEW45486.1 hypothetical protein E2R67_13980 [Psychromonas sp. RZ5]
MRLSKKGFNNLLIFGILLITFIFNFSQRLREPHETKQSTVIPKEFTILEIQTPDYTLTRVGRNWQRKPSMGISSDKLQQVVNNWQTVPLDTLTEQSFLLSDFILRFFIAEQKDPIIVQLHQLQNDHYVLQVNEKLYLSLPSNQLSLFLGR